jgi:hypothetical protein
MDCAKGQLCLIAQVRLGRIPPRDRPVIASGDRPGFWTLDARLNISLSGLTKCPSKRE